MNSVSSRFSSCAITLIACLVLAGQAFAATDPLQSWRDGANKQAIVDFVNKTTDQASGDYVAPEDRIVTFDNDGTLWVEHPMYTQLAFALDRVTELAPQHLPVTSTAPSTRA